VDASIGSLAYVGIAGQTLTIAGAAAPTAGFPAGGTIFGGVAFGILNTPTWSLKLDVLAHAGVLLLNGGTIFSGGLLAGARLTHQNGLTFGLKLPVLGYAGSLIAPRASLLYYYIAAVLVVPVLTVGYTFY